MPNYCTVRDVRAALAPGTSEGGDTTFDSSTGASLEDWQVTDALLEAQGIVDAYLLTRYSVPTMEVAETSGGSTVTNTVAQSPVRGWTRDIAAYLVNLTYLKNKDNPEDNPVRQRYTMVMGFLTDVRDRKMNLPFPGATGDGGAPASDSEVVALNLYAGRLFDLGDVGLGYVNDPGVQVFLPASQDGWPQRGA